MSAERAILAGLAVAGALVGIRASNGNPIAEAQSRQPTPQICPIDSTMVFVPGGPFLLGSTVADTVEFGALCREKDAGCRANNFIDEVPEREEVTGPYCMDKTEVTKGEFADFVGETGHKTTAEIRGESWVWNEKTGQFEVKEAADWRNAVGPFEKGERMNHPVVQVSQEDGKAFCKADGGRLPTAVEWEKAARGAEGANYPWGEEFDGSRLNYAETTPADTRPVGSFPEGTSPYGALDMAGNVSEWTGEDENNGDMVKGGSFPTGPAYQHPAWHPSKPRAFKPGETRGQDTRDTKGFRCVKPISQIDLPLVINQ